MAVMLLEWVATSMFLILVMLALRAALGRRMSAGLRYALWAVVLVRLLVPVQLFTSPVAGKVFVFSESREERDVGSWPITSGARATPGLGDVLSLDAPGLSEGSTGFPQVPDPPTVPDAPKAPAAPDWTKAPAWLGWAWLAGSAAVVLVLLMSNLRFSWRLRRERIPLDGAGLPLRAYVVTGLPSPCLFGLFRPAIYVTPEAAVDPDMLRHVLAHEYTHYRHGDHLWSLLRCAALAAHWWDPLVWVAAVLSQRDAELACDEGALKRLGDGERAAYGGTLLALVTAKPRPGDLFRCATTMAGDKESLKERIGRIACAPKRILWAAALAVLVTALACVCAFGQAEEPADEPDPSETPNGEEEPWQDQDFTRGELVFDLTWEDQPEYTDLELPEYPGVVFHCGPYTVTAVTEEGEQELYSGMPIWDVYLCDLTGDGRRELCSQISLGSGMIDERIRVYDYAEQTLYELEDRGVYDYGLRLEGERLWAVKWEYMNGPQDGGVELRAGPLVLTEYGLAIQQEAPADGGTEPIEWEERQVLTSCAPDLNRDGIPEVIATASVDDGMGTRVGVWQGGAYAGDWDNAELLWSDEGYSAHVGWNAIFLCTLDEGEYLLRYHPTMYQGHCNYMYQLFTLEGGMETVVREGYVEFDTNFHPLFRYSEFDPEAIAAFMDEINGLLVNSVQLINTDADLLQAFEKEGRLYDSLWWLDREELGIVRDGSGSLLDDLRAFKTAMDAEWYAEEPVLFPISETEGNAYVWLRYKDKSTQFEAAWEWSFQPAESVEAQVLDLNGDGRDEIVFSLIRGHGTGCLIEGLYVFDADTLEQYDTIGLNELILDHFRSTGDEENFYLDGAGLDVTISKREAQGMNGGVPLAEAIGFEDVIYYTIEDGQVWCWLGCDASDALLNYIGYIQVPVQMTPSGDFACGRALYVTE